MFEAAFLLEPRVDSSVRTERAPSSANASIANGEMHLEGFVGSLNGEINLREKISGTVENAKELGEQLAQNLIVKGANEILEETREKVEDLAESVI